MSYFISIRTAIVVFPLIALLFSIPPEGEQMLSIFVETLINKGFASRYIFKKTFYPTFTPQILCKIKKIRESFVNFQMILLLYKLNSSLSLSVL